MYTKQVQEHENTTYEMCTASGYRDLKKKIVHERI